MTWVWMVLLYLRMMKNKICICLLTISLIEERIAFVQLTFINRLKYVRSTYYVINCLN